MTEEQQEFADFILEKLTMELQLKAVAATANLTKEQKEYIEMKLNENVRFWL